MSLERHYMTARKPLLLLGVLSLLAVSFSPLFTSSAYATDSAFGGDEQVETPPSETTPLVEDHKTLLTQVSDSENYVPASPKIQPDVKATEATDYTAPQNVSYPEFEGYKEYSLNPNTKPLTKASPEIVNSYITKLSECNNFSEMKTDCTSSESQRYFLELDTSDPVAATVDLMALAQDIEAKSGVQTLVYTSNHLTTNAVEVSQTLIFSDHIELAREYITDFSNASDIDEDLLGTDKAVGLMMNMMKIFMPLMILFFILIIVVKIATAFSRGY